MKRSDSTPNVAVIGCGVFGAMVSLRLADVGCSVTVFERLDGILGGASFNNQNRLHLGFHYPRDMDTAEQCIRGFERFRKAFEPSILGDFPNAYFIASEGSRTTPDDYLAFCQALGLRHSLFDVDTFEPSIAGVDLGVLVDEVVYDCSILRNLISSWLSDSKVSVETNANVESISRTERGFDIHLTNGGAQTFDAVVNSTYADVNRFARELGHAVPDRQYEYTVVPILEWQAEPVGITVMDGPFMTVLPFGRTGQFLLYHVDHTVISRDVGQNLNRAWLDPLASPAVGLDKDRFLSEIFEACQLFVPSLSKARHVGFLQGPRVVLANSDITDTRPSIVELAEPGYVSVFAGKIDHCVWVADEVVDQLGLS
jgi:glycine/D-amino acid oxidase-like deaminating enzyme